MYFYNIFIIKTYLKIEVVIKKAPAKKQRLHLKAQVLRKT